MNNAPNVSNPSRTERNNFVMNRRCITAASGDCGASVNVFFAAIVEKFFAAADSGVGAGRAPHVKQKGITTHATPSA